MKNLSINSFGIIGIGLVGNALSNHLLKHNLKVFGYDIDETKNEAFSKRGGNRCNSPKDVANNSKILILSLMNSEIVCEVLFGKDGILEAKQKPKYIIDTTTGDPEKTIKMGKSLSKQGIAYLDATISGSSSAITRKEGVFMVGGKEKHFNTLKPIFEIFCDLYIHVGEIGNGSKAKLVVNLVMGLNRVALAEGLIFAELLDLDLSKTSELLSKTFAYSKIMELKLDRMINKNFKPGGKLSQHLKDVDLILEYANKHNQQLPLSIIHKEILENAIEQGMGDWDNSALIEEIKKRKNI